MSDQDTLFPVVAENTTTPNHPEIPDSSTCNQSLQVGQLTVGMATEGRYGPVIITAIEDRKWRFSDKPNRAIWFREISTGDESTGLYDLDAPLKNNHQIHQDNYLATLEDVTP